MKLFNRDNYDKLSKIEQLVFDDRERICKECQRHEICQQETYKYMKPIIEKNNQGYGLVYTPCDKNPRGKIKSYIDIKERKDLFDNEKKEKLVKKLLDNKCGYVYGLAGTGKSHMLAYVANELNKQGLSIYYDLSITLAKKIWNFETQEETIKDLKKYDVVLIDDIGSEMLTENLIRNFYMLLIKDRVDNKKPLYFTSNYSIAGLAERMDRYIDKVSISVLLDRLKTLSPIKYEDKNFRK